MYILRPLSQKEFNKFFSPKAIKVIQYFLNTAIFSQPEVKENKKSLPLQIPKEHLEQWFVQALQVESVGAGSYPIDILKPDEWGADVKMLSCKVDKNGNLTNGDSGETSLAQKFKDTGVSLDTMFKNRQFSEIIEGWVDILRNKLNSVLEEKNIDKIYYFFFLRGGERESYLSAFEVDISKINTEFVTQRDSDEKIDKSIFLNGFIDPRYGNAKIYKAKKRLELRLKPLGLFEDNFLIPLETKEPIKGDIFEIIDDEVKLEKHIENKIKKIYLEKF
jgi:hypothetical protein